MAIELLTAVHASAVGPYIDAHSCGRNPVSLRFMATGGFSGDAVILEHSPDSGLNWFPLGTIANLQELSVERPLDWVRARTGPALVGIANCFMDTSA